MSNIFNKILKLFPPEAAHSITISLLKYFFLLKNIQDDPILKQHILGIEFPNPIGLAAGFDKNAEIILPMLNYGFGFVEVGTITPKPQTGNIKPRVFRLKEDEAIINHLGFNNKGYEKVCKNLKKIQENKFFSGIFGINVGMNKNSKKIDQDYLFCIERLGHYGSYLTINISSPNTPGLRDLQLRGKIENLIKIIYKKKEEISYLKKKPIFIKISPDLNDEQLRDIALMSLANNVDGLIIGNTTINRSKNLISEYQNKVGGLSGKPLFKDSTLILRKMYIYTNGQIPLIGVGGISNASECYEKIKSGASLTQLYTSLVFKGPKVVMDIKKELSHLIKTDGYKNIKDVVGKSV